MSKFIAAFSVIPRQLFRLNNGNTVSLRDKTVKPRGSYDLFTVDGKVTPSKLDPSTYTAPNGASLRPNTVTQQELVNRFKGSNVIVYSIPKGTKLPDDLLLVHEHTDHYSLQAAKEMTLEEFNTKITHFLKAHGEQLTKEQWQKEYPKPTEEE